MMRARRMGVAGMAAMAMMVPTARAGELAPAPSGPSPGPATVSYSIGQPTTGRVNGKRFVDGYEVTFNWTGACDGQRMDIFRTAQELADASRRTDDWNPVIESHAAASGSTKVVLRPGLNLQPYLLSVCDNSGQPDRTAVAPPGQIPFAISDAQDY